MINLPKRLSIAFLINSIILPNNNMARITKGIMQNKIQPTCKNVAIDNFIVIILFDYKNEIHVF
jgi:hypothetical protein